MASRSCATSASSLATRSSWPVVRLAAEGADEEAGVAVGVMGPGTAVAMRTREGCMSASMPTLASSSSSSSQSM
eukprot:5939122-Alexandrium_andersonii.AAC.1